MQSYAKKQVFGADRVRISAEKKHSSSGSVGRDGPGDTEPGVNVCDTVTERHE